MADNKTNVSFKRGVSGNLPWAAASEGTFYLTTDTNRLYIGKSDGELAELNRYVQVVTNVANLPTAPALNDFVYITDDNILAVCTNPNAAVTKDKWTQINPNTNDDTAYKYSITQSETPAIKDGTDLVFYLKTKETLVNRLGEDGDIELSKTFSSDIPIKIPQEVFQSMETNASVRLTDSFSDSDDSITLNVGGVGADGSNSVNIRGDGKVVTISADGQGYLITGKDTTYAFAADADGLSIKDSAKVDIASIHFNDIDNNPVQVDFNDPASGSRTVTYSHTTATVDNPALQAQSPTNGGSFDIISGIENDGYGHLKAINTSTVTLPAIADARVTGIEVTGGDITIKQQTAAEVQIDDVTLEGQLYLKYGENKDQTVYNQGNLNVYTISEINSMMVGLNALEYQKVTYTLPDPTTEDIKIGYTYYVGDTISSNGVSAFTGDLLIAQGTEDETTGLLSTVDWQVVPFGGDVNNLYELAFNQEQNTIQLNTYTVGNQTTKTEVGVITVSGGDLITAGVDGTGKISIDHNAISPSETDDGKSSIGYGKTFDVISSIDSFDEVGHITGYTKKTIELPAEAVYSLSAAETADKNGTTFSLNKNNDIQVDTISVKAGTDLTATTDANGRSITLNHSTEGHHTGTVGAAPTKTELNFKDTITVLTNATTSNGHVNTLSATTFTLPKESTYTYTLAGSSENKFTTTIKQNDLTEIGTINYTSKSLAFGVDVNKKEVSIDLEWGTFN